MTVEGCPTVAGFYDAFYANAEQCMGRNRPCCLFDDRLIHYQFYSVVNLQIHVNVIFVLIYTTV